MLGYIRPALVDHGHVVAMTKSVTNGDTKEGLNQHRPITANTNPAPNGDTASSLETEGEVQ
jgi:hypothetical protein